VRLRIDAALRFEGSTIPAGTYEADVDEDGSTIVLRDDDNVVATLAAMLRPAKRAVRRPKVQLREVAGEPRRLLVARTPPANEWVASLDVI
jgi:hypothetical protein